MKPVRNIKTFFNAVYIVGAIIIMKISNGLKVSNGFLKKSLHLSAIIIYKKYND